MGRMCWQEMVKQLGCSIVPWAGVEQRGKLFVAESCPSGYPAALGAEGLEHLPVFLGAASLPQCCLISLGSARGGGCCLGWGWGGGLRLGLVGGHMWASAGDGRRGLSTLAVAQSKAVIRWWVKLQE